MSKNFICKGCGETFEKNMESSTPNYCYICNEFYMKQKITQLEHRLSNCIEPKFKIGQEVYTIDRSRAGNIGTGTITEIIIDEFGIVYKFTMFKSNYSENYNYKKEQELFATKEEAKAKLEEMKNG